MDMKVAVVPGGTGGVGEGIVLLLLEAGFLVVVPTRTEAKAEALHGYIPERLHQGLDIRQYSLGNEQDALEFGTYLIKTCKHIDVAVASIGGWHQGHPVYS